MESIRFTFEKYEAVMLLSSRRERDCSPLIMFQSGFFKTGSSLLIDLLRYSCLYFSGTPSGCSSAGTQRYCPVSGGFKPSSLARCASTAAMLPPAEAPPTMKPRAGFAFSDAALAAAHFSAFQESLMPVGKGCSGARLGSCQLHIFIL